VFSLRFSKPHIFLEKFIDWITFKVIYQHPQKNLDSEEVKLNDEAQEYLWVSLKDALMLKIEPYTKKLIQDYITKKGIKI